MARRLTPLYNLEHSTYQCSYHVVWTTKYRGKVLADNYIKAELKRQLKNYIKNQDHHKVGLKQAKLFG